METEKTFVAKATAEIEGLHAEFDKQASTTPEKDVLRQQTLRLFEVICCLSEYERSSPVAGDIVLEADKAILQVWDKLLEAIQRLSATQPNGPFLTSRMILFIMYGFSVQETLQFDAPDTEASRTRAQLQLDYGFNLDECLLSRLRQIWDESNGTEDFRWALTHLDKPRSEYTKKAMTALSPKELWEVPGMTGAQLWVPAPGDAPTYKGFEHSTVGVFGEVDETGERPIIRQILYSDGPLRWPDMAFRFIAEDDSESWLDGQALRRSYQFVLDVQQHLHHRVALERKYLAAKAMTQGGLPAELRSYVEQDLEVPQKHPYLSRFNLSEAYSPFPPKPDQDCGICDGAHKSETKEAEAWKIRTCPRKSVTVWNLGLRTFHTFHESLRGKLAMCSRAAICNGHHDDYNWAITNDAALANHIRTFIRDRCGPSTTLSSVGLGSRWNPDDPQTCTRTRPVPTFGLKEQAMKVIGEMEGGLYGLLATMFHRKVTHVKCSFDSEPHKCRRESYAELDRWIRGRNIEEEQTVGKDLSRLHRWGFCHYPRWCTALTGPLADDENLSVVPDLEDQPFDQAAETGSAEAGEHYYSETDDEDD